MIRGRGRWHPVESVRIEGAGLQLLQGVRSCSPWKNSHQVADRACSFSMWYMTRNLGSFSPEIWALDPNHGQALRKSLSKALHTRGIGLEWCT